MNLRFINLLKVTELCNFKMIMFDEDGSIIYANAGVCKLFNLSYAQLQQSGIQSLMPIQDKISDLVINDVIKNTDGDNLSISYLLHRVDLLDETFYLVIFSDDELFLASSAIDLTSRIKELQYFVLNQSHHNDSYNLTWLQNIQFDNYKILESYLFNNCFELFLQPIVNKLGRIEKFEVLTRLIIEERVYSPSVFLPFIQNHQLAEKFDEYVVRKFIQLLNSDFWNIEIKSRKYCFAINISPSSGDFYKHIQNLLNIIKSSGLDTNFVGLEFEITEGVLIQNELHGEQVLMRTADLLHKHNISLAMDDFGVKNSSLERLIACNFDVIKIDMSLVSQLLENGYAGRSALLVMRSIISLACDLGVELIVEGVENRELYLVLQKLGCRFFQGYYFFKPLPTHEVENLILQNQLDQFDKIVA